MIWEIGRRYRGADPLEHLWHARHGEDEAAHHDDGQDGERHRGQHGHRLGPGDRRDEDAEADARYRVDKHHRQHEEERALDRHAEPEASHREDKDPGRESDRRIGQDLAQDHLPRPDGTHQDLLHRARLLFPHYRDACEKSADEDEDDGYEARDEEVGGAHVGVVEDARAHREEEPAAPGERGALGGHDLAEVIVDELGGVRVAGVYDELDLGPTPGNQPYRVIGGYDQDAARRPGFEEVLDAVERQVPRPDPEEVRRGQTLREGAAFRRPRLVDDRRIDAFHVEGYRVAVEEEHEQRHQQHHDEALRVAQDVGDLLAEDRQEDAVHPGSPSRSTFMKTSCMEAAPCSSLSLLGFPIAAIRPPFMMDTRPQYSASSM